MKIICFIKILFNFALLNHLLQCQKTKDIARLFLLKGYFQLALYLIYSLNMLRFFIGLGNVGYPLIIVYHSICNSLLINSGSRWNFRTLTAKHLLLAKVDSVQERTQILCVWKFESMPGLLNGFTYL